MHAHYCYHKFMGRERITSDVVEGRPDQPVADTGSNETGSSHQ